MEEAALKRGGFRTNSFIIHASSEFAMRVLTV